MLASASPRRAALLEAAGFCFTVRPVELDERPLPGEQPGACCERLAREKAAAAAAREPPGTLVLAGDTVVVLDDEVLGKPADRNGAEAMLRRLAGRTHQVASAVALARAPRGPLLSGVAWATVRFDDLDEATLAGYLATDEWTDKAGAYGLQGHAGAFAHLVEGRRDTVIGLPVDLAQELAIRLAESSS